MRRYSRFRLLIMASLWGRKIVMLTFLAILPTIVLLIYIYVKDKKEKEPVRLLLGCFFLGMLASIPAMVLEEIIELGIGLITSEGTILYAVLEGIVVAGVSEEFFKHKFLTMKTWNRPEYDCLFDGIVYAVFVSLGFACFENVFYVLDGGISTAIGRMFTAVPGHMCFAVYMGYYCSMRRLSCVQGDDRAFVRYRRLELLVPILLHGIYDALLMISSEVMDEDIQIKSFIIWVIFIIVMFVKTFSFVKKASKSDDYIGINI